MPPITFTVQVVSIVTKIRILKQITTLSNECRFLGKLYL